MPNYPFEPMSGRTGGGDHARKKIMGEVTRRTGLLIQNFVPDFPLTSQQIEALLNPPEILRAVYELRSLEFARFETYANVTLKFGADIGAPRGLVCRVETESIIVSKEQKYIYRDQPALSAFKDAHALAVERMTDAQRASLREWVAVAVKHRRMQAMIEWTATLVMSHIMSTYELTATWPTLQRIVDWKNDRDLKHWYARFTEKPKNPTNYNRISNISINEDIVKRMEACDVLLLKAEFLKPVTRKPRFDLWQWQDLPGDPPWMSN